MLNNNVFYHGIIRKCIVGFGTLFSNANRVYTAIGDPTDGTVSSENWMDNF
jgi:hypothetical protein